MKKLTLLVTVAGLLLTNMLMGQVAINQDGSDADANSVLDVKNSSGTNVFYIEDASGEVGVGTTSPGALLDVAGTSEFNGTMNLTNHNITHVNYLKINDIGDQEGIIWSGSAAKIFVSPLNSGNSDGYLRLINDGGIVFEPGTEDNEAMIILSNGNVGIGKTNPTQKLDISGNLRISGAIMPNNDAGTSGQLLISEGPGAAATWGAEMLNRSQTTAIGKFYSGNFDLDDNTFLTLTVTDPNCVETSTCFFTWINLPSGPDYSKIYSTYQAQSGQWVFYFTNKTGWDFEDLEFSFVAFY